MKLFMRVLEAALSFLTCIAILYCLMAAFMLLCYLAIG